MNFIKRHPNPCSFTISLVLTISSIGKAKERVLFFSIYRDFPPIPNVHIINVTEICTIFFEFFFLLGERRLNLILDP